MQDKDAQLKKTVRIYVSYAPKDRKHFEELAKHMTSYKRGWAGFYGNIFDSRHVSGGREWQHVLDTEMEAAHLILLLISPDFINTPECLDEMERALERSPQALTIPVVLRPVNWDLLPFNTLQAIPRYGKVISPDNGTNNDKMYVETIDEITAVIKKDILPTLPKPGEQSDETVPMVSPFSIDPQENISTLGSSNANDDRRRHLNILRDRLAYLLPQDDDIDMILFDAGIPLQNVSRSRKSLTTWQNVLQEADKRGRLIDVVEAALGHYSNDATLQAELRYFKGN